MSEKVITLPNREQMLQRLLKVSDHADLQENFYPRLLKSAGRAEEGAGIVTILALAILDYVKDKPPVIAHLMFMQVPQFIEVLADEEEVVEEAKAFLDGTLLVLARQYKFQR